MKKILLFSLLLPILTGCYSKNMKEKPKFKWGIAVNTPIGYPIRFYAAMIGERPIISEVYGIIEEPAWGTSMWDEGNSYMELPSEVDMVWRSYQEDCYYQLTTDIDYDKIEKLFKEGFYRRMPSGIVRHDTYRNIAVGLAPGGVVVLWAGRGHRKMTEIGRYQAKKIKLKEPPGLDGHEKLFFSKEDREETLKNDALVPKKFRKKNKGKPIPFGLWDSYRDKQYRWFLTFEIPETGKMGDVDYRCWNGEATSIFFTDFITYPSDKYNMMYAKEDTIPKRPLIKELEFSYIDRDDKRYYVEISFKWKEMIEVFEEIYGDNPDEVTAHIDIRVNRINSYAVVRIEADNGKVGYLMEHRNLKVTKLSEYAFFGPTPFR